MNAYEYIKKQITGLYNIKNAMQKASLEKQVGLYESLEINKKFQSKHCEETLAMREEELTHDQHEELNELYNSVLSLFKEIQDPRKYMS